MTCNFPFAKHIPIRPSQCNTNPCCNVDVAYSCGQICGYTGSNPCINIDLRALRIDLLQAPLIAGPTSPTALFYIGSDLRFVNVDWVAMTTDSPNLQTGSVSTRVVNGEFEFAIPFYTSDLKITVNLPEVTVTAMAPASTVMTKFSGEDLSLYMAFKYANRVAVDTSGLDHEAPVPPRLQHQLGPHRSSRAMAIVHIAMMDAVLAIFPEYSSYSFTSPVVQASPEAAIYQAMYDTLVHLYPTHQPRLQTILTNALATIENGSLKTAGIALGSASALSIITQRSTDNAPAGEVNFVGPPAFGEWRPADPLGNQVALGKHWDQTTPFFLTTKDEVPMNPFPSFNSQQYGMEYNNAKDMGGDGVTTPTVRSQEQAYIGYFWGYDGTPSLCAPPRLYNQISIPILSEHLSTVLEIIRGISLLNVGMGDAAIAAWYYKYFFNIWRPISAIREADTLNPLTIPDTTWTPLGAPASNTSQNGFVPNFPSFPSGHSSFGGLVFQLLRNLIGRDNISFTFVSDELNGITIDHQTGLPRPNVPRSFTSLTQAEDENGFSRIPLGIHFYSDKTEGIKLGNGIADLLVARVYNSP